MYIIQVSKDPLKPETLVMFKEIYGRKFDANKVVTALQAKFPECQYDVLPTDDDMVARFFEAVTGVSLDSPPMTEQQVQYHVSTIMAPEKVRNAAKPIVEELLVTRKGECGIYAGDVFYADINMLVEEHVKGDKIVNEVYSFVCDALRANRFWVHS